MNIKLAGFNVDIELLKKATGFFNRDDDGEYGDAITPETLSAAYARISRDPAPIGKLRENAIKDVVKARASNEQIVFGLGHASVAEHAVFNFDIMGVSRLAIEAIEHARLCSYTEKSQRYMKIKEEFIVPQEIIEAGLDNQFRELMTKQYVAYQTLSEGIRLYLLEQHHATTKEEQKVIRDQAQEDARYITSLAVEGQLGMTCNARNLEYMIRRLLCNPLHEIRVIGASLYSEARHIAPSLLKYFEPTQEQLKAISDLRELVDEIAENVMESSVFCDKSVILIDWDNVADNTVMKALIHSNTDLNTYQCEQLWHDVEPEQGNRLFKAVFGSLQSWDAVPRAFELANFEFELIVSASCFAQLKRHRMATILPQQYSTILGYTVPPSIKKAGMEHIFQEVMNITQDMYDELVIHGLPLIAPYALTQAHRRRVLVKMNARELYHFSRLRQDSHAQWEIRNIADQMIYLAKRVCPLTMSLACGKDVFEKNKAELLEKKIEDFVEIL